MSAPELLDGACITPRKVPDQGGWLFVCHAGGGRRFEGYGLTPERALVALLGALKIAASA